MPERRKHMAIAILIMLFVLVANGFIIPDGCLIAAWAYFLIALIYRVSGGDE